LLKIQAEGRYSTAGDIRPYGICTSDLTEKGNRETAPDYYRQMS